MPTPLKLQGNTKQKPHRSGYQCHTCQTRVHQALTVETIEQRPKEDCELLIHEASEPDPPQHRAVGQKVTRATTISQLLERQHPQAADEHTFQETTGYLKCTTCNLSAHKRANEEKFHSFGSSRCIDEAFPHSHEGHHMVHKPKAAEPLQAMKPSQLRSRPTDRRRSPTTFHLRRPKNSGTVTSPHQALRRGTETCQTPLRRPMKGWRRKAPRKTQSRWTTFDTDKFNLQRGS